MSKKVLIITTSLRANSNSTQLANMFMEGAKQNGNQVEMISLQNKHIAFCQEMRNQRRYERHNTQDA